MEPFNVHWGSYAFAVLLLKKGKVDRLLTDVCFLSSSEGKFTF